MSRLLLLDASDLGTHIEYIVLGSRGDQYTVLRSQKGWNCSCPSATYRSRTCKHIELLQKRGIDREKSGQCYLCLDKTSLQRAMFRCLACEASMHSSCLKRWIKLRTERCPACAADFLE